MEIDKDQLKKLKKFMTDYPQEAKKLLRNDPQLFQAISELMYDDEVPVVNFGSNGATGREITGNRKTLTKPGVPDGLYVNNDKGFSNYLLLAILAFAIQLVITLICIFFYK